MAKASRKNTELETRNALRKKRLIKLAVKTGYTLCFLAVLLGILHLLRGYFYTDNDFFLYRELKMEPTEHFTPGKIQTYLEELGQEEGCVVAATNLLTLDLEKIRRKLESNPIVERAEVQHIIPGTLEIKITERIPVAYISQNRKISGMVTADSVVFPYQPADKYHPQIPFITNLPGADKLPMGMKNEGRSMAAAVFLINHLNTKPSVTNGGYTVYQVEINEEKSRLNCLLLPMADNKIFPAKGANLYIPMDISQIPTAVERLDDILKIKISENGTLRFADLTMQSNVYTME